MVFGLSSLEEKKIRCKLVNIEKPPHPLVDLHVIGSTALWTEPIVASALHVDTKGRRPDKSGYMICSRTRRKVHKYRGMWIVPVRIAQLTLCCTTVCPRVPLQRSKGHKLCEFGPDQDWFWFLNRKKNNIEEWARPSRRTYGRLSLLGRRRAKHRERPQRVRTQSDTELMARKVEKEEESKISAQSIRPCLKGAILINRNH